MSEQSDICILIVDDEAQIRRFLDISLRAQGFATLLAASGSEAIERMATRRVDLVILDLGLPDIEGHDVLRQLRGWSKVPVLVLSVRSNEQEKVRALDAGANDYVTKPFGVEELAARVRVLLRGRPGDEASPLFDDGTLRIDLARRVVSLRGSVVHLSRKEYGVLALLVHNPGRVVTQQQLLKELWAPQHHEDTHYLRIVIRKLRQKLGDDAAAPRWLETESGVGYRFRG